MAKKCIDRMFLHYGIRMQDMAAIRAKDTKPEIIGLKLCLGLVISYDSKNDKERALARWLFLQAICAIISNSSCSYQQ